MTEGNVFTLYTMAVGWYPCLAEKGGALSYLMAGGTPILPNQGGTSILANGDVSNPFELGVPLSLQTGGTCLLPDRGTPFFLMGGGSLGYLHVQVCSQARMVGSSLVSTGWRYPPIRTEWGYPTGDRATQRALATRMAVCLLRRRRRTV